MHWAATLGQRHAARDRAAAHEAGAGSDLAAEATTRSLNRWPHLVAAITRLVTEYNDAFDRDVLTVVEDPSDPGRPVVTIRAGGEADPSLVVALEGSVICIRGRDREGAIRNAECALAPDRDNDQTAAYVLQHWMEHL